MATEDAQLTDFFAGQPPLPEGEVRKGEEEEEEEEEGDREEEGEGRGERMDEQVEEDLVAPPRAKQPRSAIRALDVQTLQVCTGISVMRCVFVSVCVGSPGVSIRNTGSGSVMLGWRFCDYL